MVGPRREPQSSHRLLEHRFHGITQSAVATQIARSHMRVGVDPALPLKPRALHGTSPLDPDANSRAALVGLVADQIAVGYGGDLEVNVDPVEQRTRDPGAVAFDGQRSAAAGVKRISESNRRGRDSWLRPA